MNTVQANSISALPSVLNPDLISLKADISSRKKLLEEMARLLTIPLADECKEKDIYHQLWSREKIGNTGIGSGVALPHSRCPQATTAIVAIISLNQGVDYDSQDRQDVDLAFGLLVPEDANQEHLQLLADIAKLVSDPDKKKQLTEASSPDKIITLVNHWLN